MLGIIKGDVIKSHLKNDSGINERSNLTLHQNLNSTKLGINGKVNAESYSGV